jgi:hypothetical protein
LSLERLRLGTINDNDAAPTVATITLLRLPEVLLCLNSAGNPSAIAVDYTFTFTNGTAGSADYTTTSQTAVPAGATTGTVSVPTTADTIAESMRPLLASGTASATGTINDNDAAPTSHDHCFGYRRKSCCV